MTAKVYIRELICILPMMGIAIYWAHKAGTLQVQLDKALVENKVLRSRFIRPPSGKAEYAPIEKGDTPVTCFWEVALQENHAEEPKK